MVRAARKMRKVLLPWREFGPMRSLVGVPAVALLGCGLTVAGLLMPSSAVVLLGLCILLAVCVKGMDQAIDLETMSSRRWMAYPLAAGVPLITVYLATVQDPVFGMVLGTAIGLLAAGKWNHPAFFVAGIGFVALMLSAVVALRIDIALTSYYLIPMAAAGNYLDEFLHERIPASHGPPGRFAEHRPVLKIVALTAVLAGFAGWIHLAGFLAFDLAYDGIAHLWRE